MFYILFDTHTDAHEALPHFESDKAVKLHEEAAETYQRAENSFQQCDTDGFLSQWASTITGDQKRREAELANRGDLIITPVLIDIATGQVVAGRIHTFPNRFAPWKMQRSWKVVRGEDVQWVSVAKRASTYEKKGLREVWAITVGRMMPYDVADHMPRATGLGGCASYSGASAYVDHEISGLPL